MPAKIILWLLLLKRSPTTTSEQRLIWSDQVGGSISVERHQLTCDLY
jgi:hypothetical protein